jgi:hypothetical protein
MEPEMLLKADRNPPDESKIPNYVLEFFSRYSRLRDAHKYSRKALSFLGNYCHSMFPRQGQNSNN